MDVRIGVTQSPKELQIELSDDVDADKLVAEIETAMANEAAIVWLTDRKGRRYGVPSAKVAYVEIGTPDTSHHVGFGVR